MLTRDMLGIALGRGSDLRTVTTSAALTALLTLYIPFVASFLQVDIYPLIDRTTYHTHLNTELLLGSEIRVITINALLAIWFILSANRLVKITGTFLLAAFILGVSLLNYSFVLELLAIISVPFVLGIIFVIGYLGRNLSILTRNKLAINYLAVVGIGIAIASVYLSLSRDISTSPSSIADPFLVFYLIISYFSPIVMFLCIFTVPVNIAICPILRKLNSIKHLHIEFNFLSSLSSHRLKYLIIAMTLSALVVSIPHFNPARQDHSHISVDIIYYERWISELQNTSNITQFLNKLLVEISGGDRPLSLLLMLPIASIYPEDISATLELIMPTILAPTLVLVMFFLTRELTRNELISICCSFLTAVSFHILVGTYSGYYANWIGLIVMYVSFFFLVKYLRCPADRLALSLYIALAFAVLFIHSYTWSILIIFTLVFVLVSLFLRFITRRTFIIICLILGSLVIFDVTKTYLGLGPGAIGRDIFTIERTGTGAEQVEIRWSNLVRTVQVYVGGIYGNMFLLSIAFMGSILLYYNKMNYSMPFILVFLSLGILPLFFGDREVMSRVMYDIPFQIPAAVSLFWFARHGVVGTIFGIAIATSTVAASIRIATNI